MQLDFRTTCYTEELDGIKAEHIDLGEHDRLDNFELLEPEVKLKVEGADIRTCPDSIPQYTSIFCCDFCSFKSQNQLQYDDHIDQNHPLIFDCNLCNSTFRSEINLNSHKSNQHKEKRSRKQQFYKDCPVCKVKIVASDFKVHLESHKNVSTRTQIENENKLEILTEAQLNAMLNSNKKKKGAKKYCCEFCGKGFRGRAGFKIHSMRHLGKTPHQCTECSEAFVTKNSLFSHQVKQHGHISPWICQFCGKIFITKTGLESHENNHTGSRPYECDMCDATFSSISSLSSHKGDHEPGEYSCEKCGKVFTRKRELYSHKATHVKAKPSTKRYICSICDYKFKSRRALQVHFRIHTGEKPFSCDLCSKTSRSRELMRVHIMNHLKIRKHKCTDCGKRFANHRALIVHVRVHTGEKPHVCRICKQSFNQINSMKRHLKLHNAKYHVCTQCGLDFDLKVDLLKHCKVHEDAA